MLTTAGLSSLRKHLDADPIPLTPFLEAKAVRTNDKLLAKRLKLLKRGLIPNMPDWCAKLGTIPPYITDEPDGVGRRLFRDDEGPKPTIPIPEENDDKPSVA